MLGKGGFARVDLCTLPVQKVTTTNVARMWEARAVPEQLGDL